MKQEMARFDFRCLTHDGKESSTKSLNLHLICVLVVSMNNSFNLIAS